MTQEQSKAEYVFPSDRTLSNGLTLRDYFAAKALQVVHSEGGRYSELGLEQVATQCYAVADALLAARGK